MNHHTKLLGAVAAAVLMLGLTACGGSESGDDGSTTSDSSASDSSASSDAALPDFFPKDIPVPDFTAVKVIASPDFDGDLWSVLFVLPAAADSGAEENAAVTAYAEQLSEAGYTVEGSGGSREATNSMWDLSFRSAATGTLTLTGLPK